MQKLVDWLITYTVSVAGAVWLYLIGWIWPRNRALIRHVAVSLGIRKDNTPQSSRPGLPIIDLDEILPTPCELALYHPCPANGNVTTGELVAVIGLARQVAQRAVFEIGTFNGRTALNLAANLPPSVRVFTLDLPPERVSTTRLRLDEADVQFAKKDAIGDLLCRYDVANRVTQLIGDSASFDFSCYAGAMDMVFVDGSHSYDYVINDTQQALKMLRPGGVGVWHDYGAWAGVTKALNELHAQDPRFESIRHIRGTTLAFLKTPETPSSQTSWCGGQTRDKEREST